MNCRFCSTPLSEIFISLGKLPLANSYLKKEELDKAEPFYPLDVYICKNCLLIQLNEYESAENIFSNYAYLSSFSDTWLKHASDYVEKIVPLLNISKNSFVVEIASNDGYLLQYFVSKNIPVLGIEPASNLSEIANQKGVPTLASFFGAALATRLKQEGKIADLIIGNNVLAHVPNINDFIAGLKIILKPKGVITIEFPHLMSLIEKVEFDTIYHEHFSYFSFSTAEKIFAANGLAIFDVEELPTHGGSLRIFVKHDIDYFKGISQSVYKLKEKEVKSGYTNLKFYLNFGETVSKKKEAILNFITMAKKENKSIVGYGAPAKGNTLLNYCGIGKDLIDYTVDRNPHKQGRYLPGTHIFIDRPEKIRQTRPDYILILPWNIKDEIIEQLSFIREWGGKFIIPIPELTVI